MLPLIITAIFIAVTLLTSALLYPALTKRSIVQERLEKLTPLKKEQFSLIVKRTPWQTFLAGFGERFRFAPREQSKYTRMLVAAGFRKESFAVFIGVKVLLAVILPVIYLVLYALPKGALLQINSILFAAALAITGFLLPSFWLSRRVEKRKIEIFHILPDILDLLTVCVEAGLGLDAALMKASENPQFKGNPLVEELHKAGIETRIGKPRHEALKDMAERTMDSDVRSFVAMLSQTERFGTSLSLALRVYSDDLRTRRSQIAEEAAAKTAIKMLFPLAFFVFPALLVVILGPAFLKMQALFK
ncbi:MAG: type II secretion system F family protein [Geobacteraceae bacterium]